MSPVQSVTGAKNLLEYGVGGIGLGPHTGCCSARSEPAAPSSLPPPVPGGCLCRVGLSPELTPLYLPPPAVPGEVPRHPALQVRQPAPHPARDVLRRPREEPRPRRRSAALFLLPSPPPHHLARRTAPSFLRIPIRQPRIPSTRRPRTGETGPEQLLLHAPALLRPRIWAPRGFDEGLLAANRPLLSFPGGKGCGGGGGRHVCTRRAGVTAVSLLNFIEVSCCCLVWKALRGVRCEPARVWTRPPLLARGIVKWVKEAAGKGCGLLEAQGTTSPLF